MIDSPHHQDDQTLTALTRQLEDSLNASPPDNHKMGDHDILAEQSQILHQLFTMIINNKIVGTDENGAPCYRRYFTEYLDLALNIQKQCNTTVKTKGAIDYMSAITPPPPLKIKKQTE